MCNGARYGVPQPVIIFPLSPFFSFYLFFSPRLTFLQLSMLPMLFLQPGDTLACAVRRFLVWLHTSDIPQELISHLRGRRRGKKKEKNKKKTRKKTRCIAPVLTHFPSVPISWSRLKCGSAGPRASGAAVLIHRVPVRTILRAKARANMIR